jgi:hypothetical protein
MIDKLKVASSQNLHVERNFYDFLAIYLAKICHKKIAGSKRLPPGIAIDSKKN